MWSIYILSCSDGSYYTGSTNNIEKRLKAHFDGNGAKYTRSHKPVRLIYQENFQTKSESLKREVKIKKMTKVKKEALIREDLGLLKKL